MSIFTTGAHIAPMQLKDGQFAWVVTEFEDDTFRDGAYLSVPDAAFGEPEYHAFAASLLVAGGDINAQYIAHDILRAAADTNASLPPGWRLEASKTEPGIWLILDASGKVLCRLWLSRARDTWLLAGPTGQGIAEGDFDEVAQALIDTIRILPTRDTFEAPTIQISGFAVACPPQTVATRQTPIIQIAGFAWEDPDVQQIGAWLTMPDMPAILIDEFEQSGIPDLDAYCRTWQAYADKHGYQFCGSDDVVQRQDDSGSLRWVRA